MFLDPGTMKLDFAPAAMIGSGSDGSVRKYVHRRSGRYIAVKMPISSNTRPKRSLQAEIRNMSKFSCTQVVDFLGSDEDWTPYGPALFLEYCELGDALIYPTKLKGAYGSVPEESLFKFFADMAKGLNYIHNELTLPLVHGDLKPENIFVARPMDCHDEVPILPNFKIGDFARAAPYMCPSGGKINWHGTPEFSPPPEETEAGATPAADIWGLGASIQTFALGFNPVQSSATFKATIKAQYPGQEFTPEQLRFLRPVVYRPLNATKAAQETIWDWPSSSVVPPQYGNSLNRWYTMCMEKDMHKRATAETLVRWFVPVAQRQIAVLQAKRRIDEATIRAKAAKLTKRGPVPGRRLRRVRNPYPTPPKSRPAFSFQESPVILRRMDFGLGNRPARELLRQKRHSSEDSNEFRNLLTKEQKYLKGMRKPDRG